VIEVKPILSEIISDFNEYDFSYVVHTQHLLTTLVNYNGQA